MSRPSPFKRAASDLNNILNDADSKMPCHLPRYNKHPEIFVSPSDSLDGNTLMMSPLLKSFLKEHTDARRRFQGEFEVETSDKRSDAAAMSHTSDMSRDRSLRGNDSRKSDQMKSPETLDFGVTGARQKRSTTKQKTTAVTPRSTLLNVTPLQPNNHCQQSLQLSNRRVNFNSRKFCRPLKSALLLSPSPVVSRPTITALLTKALTSTDEIEVADCLTNISVFAYHDKSLSVDEIVNKLERTQLLFYGSGIFTQSGIVRISSLLCEPSIWSDSMLVQQAALVAIVAGIKLTFDCVPDDFNGVDVENGGKFYHPSGPALRNVLEADTLTVLRSIVFVLETALQKKGVSLARDVVYTSLGALWHLTACPFRCKSTCWLLLWMENGLASIFKSMSGFPDVQSIQEIGKAIIMLSLRYDKIKTVERGLEWNLRSPIP
ncbi:hypothetical protein MPSEU_000257500 [Mayamaea pseudoterrestris]|nr:hypothetical protein MPSEU_000257500 [Mayamaea pseudoterrestris]